VTVFSSQSQEDPNSFGGTVGPVDPHPLTGEQVGHLVELAGDFHNDADLCAQAGQWRAAMVMLGCSVEAGLLATACASEEELKTAGLWPSDSDPITRWELGKLLELGRKASWLPTSLPKNTDMFSSLEGEVGDAVQFFLRIRNASVHPGNYVRLLAEVDGPDFRDSAAMKPTYDLLEGISGVLFEKLRTVMTSLARPPAPETS
jgi:hypothetical protein